MLEKKIIALLPMKGNSERVPSKNLKSFCGKPLYHRVLIELLNSKYISSVVINTDSPLIKQDIRSNFDERVIIVNRPSELVGDMVSMNKIIEHDIEQVDADIYIQTHSTNPLLRQSTIDAAIEKMIYVSEKRKYDSVFSVTKIQTRLYDANGSPINHNPKQLIRTQDLDPVFEENSNFFLFTKESFREAGNKRIGKNPLLFEIDKLEAIDIDELQDFIIAESIYELLKNNQLAK